MMRVRVTGDDFRGLGGEVLFEYRPGCVEAVRAGQDAFLRKIDELLSQPGRGRIYRRGGRVHQASAPGDPPAEDLGTYRRSFRKYPLQVRGDEVSGEAGTDDPRAVWFELGTSQMLPRPHIEEAQRAAEEATDQAFERYEPRAGRFRGARGRFVRGLPV